MTEAICPTTFTPATCNEQVVGLVFRKTHLVHHVGCHRESGDAVRADLQDYFYFESVFQMTCLGLLIT